ncbi:MAG: carbohydrate ABC transporter permease [Bacillota bacterium]
MKGCNTYVNFSTNVPPVTGVPWSRKQLTSILRLLGYGILLAGAVWTLLPLAWMVSASFKPLSEVMRIPPTWIPVHPTLDNFRQVFVQFPFGRYLLNSVIVATAVIGSVLLTSALAGYSLAKFDIPGRTFIFFLILSSLMVPFQTRMIPLYKTTVALRLVDTRLGVMFPWLVDAFGIFLMRQFIATIPTELIEAARIDGASEPFIFLRVILPLSKQALSALAIFTLTANWEEFLWPLIVSTSDASRTLPVGLQSFAEQYGTNIHWQMAGSVIAVAPLLVVFLVLQRQFVEGIAMTGLKG